TPRRAADRLRARRRARWHRLGAAEPGVQRLRGDRRLRQGVGDHDRDRQHARPEDDRGHEHRDRDLPGPRQVPGPERPDPEPVIYGAHVIVYSSDPDADRAFLADILGFEHVDAGGGWLIFGLPPAEMAVHPADAPASELYLMCDDLVAQMQR